MREAELRIAPQPGPQEAFAASPADIAIYGGEAGGGKSWALTFEAARFTDRPDYRAVIFRRKSTEIIGGGGLWDEAHKLYMPLGAAFREAPYKATFPTGSRVEFSHLEHEKNKYDHQGKQYAFIGFDELTHFTEGQFWYLVSRMRTTCGVRPYMRATCNPDPDSFVRRLIDWWIDADGFAIPGRSGVLRWFVRVGDDLEWFDTEEEARERYPASRPRSLTFIHARLEDNPALLEADPDYLAAVESLPLVERARLRGGNWNIRNTAGNVFRREWFEVVDAAPADASRTVRAWDRAASEPTAKYPDPDYTACVKLSNKGGVLYVEHADWFRRSAHHVDEAISNYASQDGTGCTVALFKDPGAAGKREAEDMARKLHGYKLHIEQASKGKIELAKPVASQAEAGNIKLVRGDWNERFIEYLQSFPEGAHDDPVDALSLAYIVAATRAVVFV